MIVLLTLVLFITWAVMYFQREMIRELEDRIETLEFKDLWKVDSNEKNLSGD